MFTHTDTSDLQSVTAIAVEESTIDIQCTFIEGSDAKGCTFVLISDHPSINNETDTLTRNSMFAYGQLNLTHKASCYHRVYAYNIPDNGHTASIIYVTGEVSNVDTNVMCSGKMFDGYSN